MKAATALLAVIGGLIVAHEMLTLGEIAWIKWRKARCLLSLR